MTSPGHTHSSCGAPLPGGRTPMHAPMYLVVCARPFLRITTLTAIVLLVAGVLDTSVVHAFMAAEQEQGYVTTIANTTSTPWGVHMDPTTGVVLFTQPHSLNCIHANGTVEVVAGSGNGGNSNGIGTAVAFHTPWGIAGTGDPNRVYVADYNNHCLRRVDLATRSVTTGAGLCGTFGSADGVGTASRFRHPAGMALFNSVWLYVADHSNHIVRRIDLITGQVSTFAGVATSLGTADGARLTTARFRSPNDVAVDATGQRVYVADTWNHCIRRIDASGSNGMVTTVAGLCGSSNSGFIDGVGTAARFNLPAGVTVDGRGTTLYISDASNCAIRRVSTTDGNVTTLSSRLGCSSSLVVDGPLLTARFNYPIGIRYYRLQTHGSVRTHEVFLVAGRDNRAIRWVVLHGHGWLSSTSSASLSATGSASSASLSATGSAVLLRPNHDTTIAPPIPVGVRTAVQVATVTVGALATLFQPGGAGTAVLLQRSMLGLRLSMCDASAGTADGPLSVADSPTRLSFGAAEGAYARGAVVGNTVLLAAVGLVVVAVATFRVWRRGEQLSVVYIAVQCNMSGLPGVMAAPLMLLLQPTVAAGIALLCGRHVPADVFYGLSGIATPFALALWFVGRTCIGFPCASHKMSNHTKPPLSSTLLVRYLSFFSPRVRWAPGRSTPAYYLEAYGAVFEEYTTNRHWFFAIESCIAIAAGVVAGMDSPETEAGCDVLLWVNLAVAVFGCCTVVLWPYRSAHGNAQYAIGNGAAAASAVLLLVDAEAASDWIAVSLTLMVVLCAISDMAAVLYRLYHQWVASSLLGRRGAVAGSFIAFLIQRIKHGDVFAPNTTPQRNLRISGPRTQAMSRSTTCLHQPEYTRRLGVLIGLICEASR